MSGGRGLEHGKSGCSLSGRLSAFLAYTLKDRRGHSALHTLEEHVKASRQQDTTQWYQVLCGEFRLCSCDIEYVQGQGELIHVWDAKTAQEQ